MKKNTWQWGNTQYLILGCLILIIGFCFFMFGLTHEDVWYDESYTWAITNHSLGDIIKNISGDTHPPLYFLLLKPFCLLMGGNSIFIIRLFSVLGALALVALGLGPVRRALGDKTSLLYMGLVVLTPVILSMAHEGRMYTWVAFFVTGAVLYAYLTATDGKLSDWVKLGLLTLGSAYIHYYGLLAVAIANFLLLIWLVKKEPRRLRHYWITMSLVLICYLPWISAFIAQTGRVQQGFWAPAISFDLILRTLYYPFGDKFSFYAPGLLIFRPFAFGLAGIVILWGLWQTTVKKQMMRRQNLFLIMVYLLTIIAAIILSYLVRPILAERYITAVIGLFILSLAVGLSCLGKKSIFWGVVILFLVFNLSGMYQVYRERFNGPLTEVASYLTPKLPADAVLVHFDWMAMGTSCYYFPGHKHFIYLPEQDRNYNNSLFPETSFGPDLDSFLKGYKNIWVITNADVPGEANLKAVSASKKFTIVSQPKVFQLPFSWYKVSVSQMKRD